MLQLFYGIPRKKKSFTDFDAKPWLKPTAMGLAQAFYGLGSAEPLKAEPKPRLSGRAEPAHHYPKLNLIYLNHGI